MTNWRRSRSGGSPSLFRGESAFGAHRVTYWGLSALLFAMPACKSSEATEQGSSPQASSAQALPDRDPALAKRLVEGEGALLLDVRTKEEWQDDHIDGATLIPVQELERRLQEVEEATGGDKDKPIVVYCRSGARSSRAKEMLIDAGYTRVTNVGGIADYPR